MAAVMDVGQHVQQELASASTVVRCSVKREKNQVFKMSTNVKKKIGENTPRVNILRNNY